MRYLPASIRAGLTTEVTYPDSGYSVVKMTANASGTVINLTATVPTSGAGHLFTFPAATAYTAGTYQYAVYAEDGAAKIALEQGAFTILPALAAGDPRTQARIILDAVNAVIQGRATANQRAVRVGDKSIDYLTFSELVQMKEYYEELVQAEQDQLDGVNRQVYYTEFRRI
jgi:hypothetical protein